MRTHSTRFLARSTRVGALVGALSLVSVVVASRGALADATGASPSASASPSTSPSAASSVTLTTPADSFTAGDSTRLSPGKLPIAADGLTADAVATRALKSSVAAKIDEAKLRAAAAAVDSAYDQYIPRLTVKGSYTRQSHIDAADARIPVQTGFFGGPVQFTQYQVPFKISTPPDDQFAFGASLLVPFTDYVFKIHHQHEASLQSVEAQKWNAKVTQAQTATDSRVAFYNWIRARGSIVVSAASLAQSQAHLKDLRSMLALKAATLADVYRVEAQVAAAQLTLTRSENLAIVTEENLRILMHSTDDEAFHLGEDVSAELPLFVGDMASLRAQARLKRPELQALVAQIESAQASSSASQALLYPRLDGFADALYARTNQRWAFYAPGDFKATWDIGLQLTWSPNDVLFAGDTHRQLDATVAQLKATREQLEDSLAIDVVTAFTKVREEESAVVSAGAQRRAAEEAYRVRLEQFHGGVATSSQLIDSESDLTLARLSDLNARVDLRIAHVQLKKAVGAL